ncbi:hypothetical protein EHI8A_039380 [Entamoeba histolytica HM-1:IMSS-B]|uniref:Chaperone DnaJ C-terminal domain-containing protein n=1 Tax=Entamoeba histolytica HM-1:IMSS-B TaxID=885319 RepID=M3UJV0_ENTH1|nr:hypothetical protein EHI8A_039380 [Entamoeba histolytica HM-1:IMSS-B]
MKGKMTYYGMNVYQLTELDEHTQPQQIIDKMNELYGELKKAKIDNKKERMEEWNVVMDNYEIDPIGYYKYCEVWRINKLTAKEYNEMISKTIKIERGVDSDDEYIFEKEGNEEIGKKQGDLKILFEVICHDFIRNKENVILKYPINHYDEQHGFIISHRGINDDEWINKRVEPNKVKIGDSESVITIYGKGLPKKGGEIGEYGDIFILFTEKETN